MGTNYYLYNWHGEEVQHLAKTSGGWVPAINDSDEYDSWGGFVEFVRQHGHIVKNEYGERVDKDEFLGKLRRFAEEHDRRHEDSEYSDNGCDFIGGWFR